MRMITKENMVSHLKEKGLKMTPQRLAIIDVLVESREQHPGAHLIYTNARKKAKNVSLSTVYSTLHELSASGLVKSLEFDRMENRYDGNLADHINLICKRCGKIIDYDLPSTIEPKDIVRKAGFVVTDTRIEYYGYCRDCLKRPT